MDFIEATTQFFTNWWVAVNDPRVQWFLFYLAFATLAILGIVGIIKLLEKKG